MSTRDHDPKLTEDRVGVYTPGARVPAAAERTASRVEGAEPKSWSSARDDDAHRDGFGGADVTAYGQMVSGGSDQVGGGFGGAGVGGYGQQGLGSQWGQAGFGPLSQGSTYSTGGGTFGPSGFAPYPEGSSRGPRSGAGPQARGGPFERPSPTPLFGSARDVEPGREFGGSAHDHHEPHYRHWRDAKLAAHDQEYSRWRDEQARRYDEDYRTWRNSHHSAFTQAFDGWRDQRTASSEPVAGVAHGAHEAVDSNLVHGANPTLGNIADGGTGAPRRRHDQDHDHELGAAAAQDRSDR